MYLSLEQKLNVMVPETFGSQFGPGEPDRDLARAMMERVLDQWDTLSKSTSALIRSCLTVLSK